MTEELKDQESQRVLRAAVREFLKEVPAGYAAIATRIDALLAVARQEAATAIRAPLNQQAATFPQNTYAEKKALAAWVNVELRRMGLALRCPRSGEPSVIQASIGHDPAVGKFRLDYVDSEGKHHNQTVSVRLPELDPMPDTSPHTPHRTRFVRGR